MKMTPSLALVIPILVVAMAGCSTPGGGQMGIFSATAPVVAILHEDLMLGEAVGYMDRTGTISVRSAVNPELRCVGEFRYTGSKTGTATLRCNDGAEAVLSFNALSTLSGYGYGRTSRGPASFTYGLTPDEAAQYLTLPPRKRLVQKKEGPRLEDV